ncbi:CLI_3235 family bacteriocin precursor [Clostridium saccharoperbutylacetonicum]|uniref:CLI_3235 family bacteriocin precursor n=1 Tax=Clostridium saccharoperbutylacetonicum TaxID=36745 RepID=UPI0039EC9EE0
MSKKILGKKQQMDKNTLVAFSCSCNYCPPGKCTCGPNAGTAQHTSAMQYVNNVKVSMNMTAINM